MSNLAKTAHVADTALDDAAAAIASRALSIIAAPVAPAAPQTPPGTDALLAAAKALVAAGSALPPQAVAMLASLGQIYPQAGTNRPVPALTLTGPKAYAAHEIEYRQRRASGNATWLPTQYARVNPASAHRKTPQTGGWYRNLILAMVPNCGAYTKTLGAKGSVEMRHNQLNGYYIVQDEPIAAARNLYLEGLTDAEIARLDPKVKPWATLARDTALSVAAEILAASGAESGAEDGTNDQ
jgi:hypothetical protein